MNLSEILTLYPNSAAVVISQDDETKEVMFHAMGTPVGTKFTRDVARELCDRTKEAVRKAGSVSAAFFEPQAPDFAAIALKQARAAIMEDIAALRKDVATFLERQRQPQQIAAARPVGKPTPSRRKAARKAKRK
jgi:hypothetical protein